MKLIMIIIIASFLGLTACGSDGSSSSSDSSSSAEFFGNLDIKCGSESCI